MVDVHDKMTRHKNMQAIRSQQTAPERKIASILDAIGVGYQKNVSTLPGKPDFLLPKQQAVIFVQGCFWHGHQCHLFKLPQTRTDFWYKKINQTIKRDREKAQALLKLDYRLLFVWECVTKGKSKLSDQQISDRLDDFIFGSVQLGQLDTRGISVCRIDNWFPDELSKD